MKWIITLIYIAATLLVAGCTSQSNNETQPIAAPIEVISEHPLTVETRELSAQLLQQAYFYQGSFAHGQTLLITYPNTATKLPISKQELQRAAVETFEMPGWFNIQVLTEQTSEQSIKFSDDGYSLMISLIADAKNSDAYTLMIKFINNRFNTVEAQVSRNVSL